MKDETRCDHIFFYRVPDSKPSILELGPPVRHDPDGWSVLDGSVLLRGWDGISEKKIKNASTLHCAGKRGKPQM